LTERNVVFEFRVQVADLFGCVTHPETFKVFRNATLSEPRKAKAAERVEPDTFHAVEDSKEIAL
jgi:hypothetical protein